MFDRARTQSRVGVEIFDHREKILPDLDGVERHTALAEGKATRLFLLPHGECGVWGNAPQVKFRDGVRPPFSKGEEDWGLPPAPKLRQQIGRGQSPLEGVEGKPPRKLPNKIWCNLLHHLLKVGFLCGRMYLTQN
jgi:hypothetical protein